MPQTVKTAPCLHAPDWSTVKKADGVSDVIDVWCKLCGLSGSFTVPERDIQWDNLPKENQ